MVVEINMGIIGDGATDRKIFIKLIKSILFNNPLQINYIELSRKQIRDSIDRYWREASKNNTYYLPASHAVQLQNEVVNVIKNAFGDFENELGVGQQVSHHDIILLTTDSERHLSTTELRALSAEDFNNKALNFIMPACINDLFEKVPESRPFIQLLSLLSATLVDNREH